MTMTATPRHVNPSGPDGFSLATTPLTPLFGTTRLSNASGFFLRDVRGQHYLVTNWHVVTGVNPITGAHISPTAAEPDAIEFDRFRVPQGARVQQKVRLYDSDGQPVWREHARWGRAVDVVCVPLQLAAGEVKPLNDLSFDPLRISVGSDAFVIGYPLGLGPERLPIWKRASIATEPSVQVDGLPLMYVDTASASGMSGSPVIVRSTAERWMTEVSGSSSA